MNNVTGTIENGFVYLPDKAPWLQDFLHEISVFPKGKYDDQADSLSQALDWCTNIYSRKIGILEYHKRLNERDQN